MRPASLGMVTAAPTSVMKLNLCFRLFTRVAGLQQPRLRIGFPSGRQNEPLQKQSFFRSVPVVRAIKSGFVPVAPVKYPDTGCRANSFEYSTRFDCFLSPEDFAAGAHLARRRFFEVTSR